MQQDINPLDRCRYIDGIEAFYRVTEMMIKNSINEFIEVLNDERLCFMSLYLLKDKIKEINVFKDMNERNKVALDFLNEIITEGAFDEKIRTPESFYNTLRWIIDTGHNEDGIKDEFDQIMDAAITFLIVEYGDRSILPLTSDLIFKRSRKGLYIHDIVWAFFEARDIYSLILIGKRLDSENKVDSDLAKQLLSFIPSEVLDIRDDSEVYKSFISWFDINSRYLYYYGESFQSSNKPLVYKINYEAKYICHIISSVSGEFLKDPNKVECELLEEFRTLGEEEMIYLSDFSADLYRKNTKLWGEWMLNPVNDQLRTARGGVV